MWLSNVKGGENLPQLSQCSWYLALNNDCPTAPSGTVQQPDAKECLANKWSPYYWPRSDLEQCRHSQEPCYEDWNQDSIFRSSIFLHWCAGALECWGDNWPLFGHRVWVWVWVQDLNLKSWTLAPILSNWMVRSQWIHPWLGTLGIKT